MRTTNVTNFWMLRKNMATVIRPRMTPPRALFTGVFPFVLALENMFDKQIPPRKNFQASPTIMAGAMAVFKM